MHRLLSPLVLLALLLGGVGLSAPASADAGAVMPARFVDMDCSDFPTQAAAQAFFLNAGPGDPHRLDSDGDGIACETNPCPCVGAGTPVPVVGLPTTTPVPTPVPTSVVTATPLPTAPPTPTPSTGTDPDGSGNSGPVRRDWATVVKVTDGDTLKVRVVGVGVRSIRLLGIDTPEVYGGRECGGDEASAQMRRLAPVGSRVRLESDPTQADRDRYGRWLRYVARRGVDVGRAQIRLGMAITYVYRNDPFRRTGLYQRTEKAAQSRQKGSWARCW